MTLEKSISFRLFAHENLPKAKAGQLKTLGSLSQYEKLYRIADSVPKGAKILDWGCGNGHFSAYLKYLGHQPVSFSFDLPELIDSSFHVLGDDKNPVALPFEDESFDYIFSIGVLEHVHETGGSQEKSLLELNRILRLKGRFYAYHFPNKYSWIEATANVLQKVGLHRHYTHTKKFDKKSVRELFSGWRLIRVERYALLPRNVWNRLPEAFGNLPMLIKAYDLFDRIITKVFPYIAQNYLIIAEKK